jgi:putative transposase
MQNGFCESFNGRMRDELLNESLFLDFDMRDQGLRTGSTITTSDGRTRRWATSHRWPMPPISPQHAIGCATPTSSADRMLLHPRPTA